MTKYNDSMSSLADVVDQLFEEATAAMYSISSSGSSVSNCSVSFSPTECYHNQIWTWTGTAIPKIDIPSYPVSNGWIKDDGSLFLQIACTGFEKFELTVKAEDNILSVEAKKLNPTIGFESQTKKWKQLFHNLPTRDFEWKRRLSNKYDLEKLGARVINGILEITIPFRDARKPVKKEFEIK